MYFFFLMIRRPPRSTLDRSSAASDVYKRQRCGEPIWGTLENAAKEKGFSDLEIIKFVSDLNNLCLLYTSLSPRDRTRSRMPSSA